MKKVLILVMSHEGFPYNKLMEASRGTWDNIQVEGAETVFYVGNAHSTSMSDKILRLPVKDILDTVAAKTRMAFQWAVEQEGWDYIFRANASSYVNKRELIKYVQTLPESIYQGLVAPFRDMNYIWGCGYIISRNMVNLAIQDDWDYSLMDDVGLSLHLQSKGAKMDPGGRMVTIHRNPGGDEFLLYNYEGNRAIYSMSDLPVEGQFLYRVKQDRNRNLDVKLMHELHEQFEKYYANHTA